MSDAMKFPCLLRALFPALLALLSAALPARLALADGAMPSAQVPNTSAQVPPPIPDAPALNPTPAPNPIPAPALDQAPGPTPARPMVGIQIRGPITPRTLDQVRNALAIASGDAFPAGALLLLDSSGGDGMAAMDIGRLARAARAHVFVAGKCSSACVLLFAGGVVRGAVSGTLGIHRGRVTRFIKDVGRQDVSTETNEQARQFLALADQRAEEYFAEMGMPASLIQASRAVPSDRVRWLDAAAIAEYGLAGVDPAYRAARAPSGARRYGISEEEFVRRSNAVAELCRADAGAVSTFSACYRRVLATGG